MESLEQDERIASDWRLLVADGFDSFNQVSLKALTLLSGRVGELCLTLSGDLEMARPAYRRFQRTLAEIRKALAPEIETLAPRVNPQPALAHLQASLLNQTLSNSTRAIPSPGCRPRHRGSKRVRLRAGSRCASYGMAYRRTGAR